MGNKVTVKKNEGPVASRVFALYAATIPSFPYDLPHTTRSRARSNTESLNKIKQNKNKLLGFILK